MNLYQTLAASSLVILLASNSETAPVPAVAIDPRTDVADPPGPGQFFGYELGNWHSVIGWSFTVEETVTLTHFAWYDENGDGLSHDHRIGLWSSDDFVNFELVVEATSPAGNSSELHGPWRRVSISPMELEAGWYLIGGIDNLESTDPIIFLNASPPPILPIDTRLGEITVGAERNAPDFGPPDQALLAPSLYLGPMFFIEPVPEPGTLALLAIGAMLVVPMARSRMKCKA